MAVDGEYETARRLVIQLTDINDNNPTFDKCTDVSLKRMLYNCHKSSVTAQLFYS